MRCQGMPQRQRRRGKRGARKRSSSHLPRRCYQGLNLAFIGLGLRVSSGRGDLNRDLRPKSACQQAVCRSVPFAVDRATKNITATTVIRRHPGRSRALRVDLPASWGSGASMEALVCCNARSTTTDAPHGKWARRPERQPTGDDGSRTIFDGSACRSLADAGAGIETSKVGRYCRKAAGSLETAGGAIVAGAISTGYAGVEHQQCRLRRTRRGGVCRTKAASRATRRRVVAERNVRVAAPS